MIPLKLSGKRLQRLSADMISITNNSIEAYKMPSSTKKKYNKIYFFEEKVVNFDFSDIVICDSEGSNKSLLPSALYLNESLTYIEKYGDKFPIQDSIISNRM